MTAPEMLDVPVAGAAPARRRAASPRRILVISFSDLRTDPRVRRQLSLLGPDFEVTAVGFGCPDDLPVRCIAVPNQHWSGLRKATAAILLKSRCYESVYWSSLCVRAALAALKEEQFDLIVANDILALPLALALRKSARILFDAHEYAPLEFEDLPYWRFFFQDFYLYLCGKYLASADGMTTVCQSIADEYRARFGVTAEVIMNVPPYQQLQPANTDSGAIRMVHHGGAIPSRRIELMIDAMEHLDERFHLDFMLVPGRSKYIEWLITRVAGQPRTRIIPAVPMQELPRHLNRYDIGLFLLPPTNFNYRYALPNKFFEFIQARLAVAIGPSPEMARLARQYDCGIVSDDFSPRSLARRLNELDQGRIDYYKQRSNLAAGELCFERSSEVLLKMVKRLVGSG